MRLPYGALAKVKEADPKLKADYQRANRKVDSVRHSGLGSEKLRQAVVERAKCYALIDTRYEVPAAFWAVGSVVTARIANFTTALGKLCSGLERDVGAAVDAPVAKAENSSGQGAL